MTLSSRTGTLCVVVTHSPDTVKGCDMNSVATDTTRRHRFRGGEYVAGLMAELERAAIARRIADAREQAGLSQAELADLLHVHFRTVQDWESPKKSATPWDRMDELASATSTTKEWLLHGDPVGENRAQAGLLRDVSGALEALERSQEDVHAKLDQALAALARLEGARSPGEGSRRGRRKGTPPA